MLPFVLNNMTWGFYRETPQRGRCIAMTNEQIVSEIRNGYSVTDYMQLLYESNLPLIKKFIKPYAAYEPVEDLLQETYFGLWEAVQHYETSANVRFMTCAEYWIRQSVQMYLEKCGATVRIPSHTRQKIARYKKCLRLEGSNFRLGGIAPITRAVPSFRVPMRLAVSVAWQKGN